MFYWGKCTYGEEESTDLAGWPIKKWVQMLIRKSKYLVGVWESDFNELSENFSVRDG